MAELLDRIKLRQTFDSDVSAESKLIYALRQLEQAAERDLDDYSERSVGGGQWTQGAAKATKEFLEELRLIVALYDQSKITKQNIASDD